MREIRKHEQKKAAVIGDYSALIILEHPSSNIRDRDDHTVVSELMEIIKLPGRSSIYPQSCGQAYDPCGSGSQSDLRPEELP